MRKKMLFALTALIVSAFVCYNSGQKNHETISSLLLANIEALAGDEYYKRFCGKILRYMAGRDLLRYIRKYGSRILLGIYVC